MFSQVTRERSHEKIRRLEDSNYLVNLPMQVTAEGAQIDEKVLPVTGNKRQKMMPAAKTPPDSFHPFSDALSNWFWCLRQEKTMPVSGIVIDDTRKNGIDVID